MYQNLKKMRSNNFYQMDHLQCVVYFEGDPFPQNVNANYDSSIAEMNNMQKKIDHTWLYIEQVNNLAMWWSRWSKYIIIGGLGIILIMWFLSKAKGGT